MVGDGVGEEVTPGVRVADGLRVGVEVQVGVLVGVSVSVGVEVAELVGRAVMVTVPEGARASGGVCVDPGGEKERVRMVTSIKAVTSAHSARGIFSSSLPLAPRSKP